MDIAPIIKTTHQWFSVTQQLPAHADEVLVFYPAVNEAQIAQCVWTKDGKRRWESRIAVKTDAIVIVTHWAELPHRDQLK